MKKNRSAHCIFCDDYRQEIGNKTSLMGIYQSDMIIHAQSVPVVLPKLVAQLWITSPIKYPIKSITSWVLGTEGEELGRTEAILERNPSFEAKDVQRFAIGLTMQMFGVNLAKDGFIETWVTIDGETERAGRLILRIITPQELEK